MGASLALKYAHCHIWAQFRCQERVRVFFLDASAAVSMVLSRQWKITRTEDFARDVDKEIVSAVEGSPEIVRLVGGKKRACELLCKRGTAITVSLLVDACCI